jgi:3-polyprenyl-4-hydroxybenzoate decarboxylase
VKCPWALKPRVSLTADRLSSPWKEVKSAPVQEIVHREVDLGKQLPLPTHNEHDNGAYITAGLCIARNPVTGVQNVSLHRLQLSGSNRLGALLLPRHTHMFYEMAERNGQPLDVAIVIGVDPLTPLSSQAIAPIDFDELTIAGALHGMPLQATLLAHLRRSFPNVRDVHLARGGVCRYHLYVQIAKRQEGEAKNVMMGAFAGHYDVKHVIVVDEDVDIHNPAEVEWAVATRFQADRDLVIVPESQGSKLDPSTRNGVGAKMGIRSP